MPPLHCEPSSFANQIHSAPKREHHDLCLKLQTKHACRTSDLVCEFDSDWCHERSFPFPFPLLAESACIFERISYATLDGLATVVLNCTCAKVCGNQVKFVVIVGWSNDLDSSCVYRKICLCAYSAPFRYTLHLHYIRYTLYKFNDYTCYAFVNKLVYIKSIKILSTINIHFLLF